MPKCYYVLRHKRGVYLPRRLLLSRQSPLSRKLEVSCETSDRITPSETLIFTYERGFYFLADSEWKHGHDNSHLPGVGPAYFRQPRPHHSV